MKQELIETFYAIGLKTTTASTDTQNSGDLYFQFADGSRLHCQKTRFTLYTCPKAATLYFSKYTFKECSDGSYRTMKAKVSRTVEDIEYILGVFYRDANNRVLIE